jgi:ATP-dependent RNA helicase RhlE
LARTCVFARAACRIESFIVTTFSDFGLAEPILRALASENYATPTPIQAQTIPLALQGRDVVGIAQTGTGKTASFALPILHKIAANRTRPDKKSCRVLVLSPTRELSGQILDSFRTYGRNINISATLAIGGVPMGKQVRAVMNGVEIMVATPGRLLDLIRGNALRLRQVEFLVLDEADRMLDMGFIHDIKKIVALLPKERQTLFFSATMPEAIADLAKHMLRDPARVAVTPVASTAEKIDQRVILLDRSAKQATLAQLLQQPEVKRTLVFTRTKHGADSVVKRLLKSGIPAEAIHGNKSQNNRERVLSAFRSGALRTLVATDIAARGIDVDGISHVVNFDVPNVADSYVHRIGRTARAGATGVAISLCDNEEIAYLRDIERLIRLSIPVTDQRTGDRQTANPAGTHVPGEHRNASRNKRRRPRRGGNGHAGHGNGHGHSQNGGQAGKPRRDHGQASSHSSSHHEGNDISAVGFLREPHRHRRQHRRTEPSSPA